MQDNAGGRDPARESIESRNWKRERAAAPQRTEPPERLGVEVVAAVVSIVGHQPVVLTTRAPGDTRGNQLQLPAVHFCPSRHDTLEAALRTLLAAGDRKLGYLEQLTADCRSTPGERAERTAVSIGYLALVRAEGMPALPHAEWARIYDLLPWEDWRKGRPKCLTDEIVPGLLGWAEAQPAETADASRSALARVTIAFGLNESSWDDERVVERLDLMLEAGLVARLPAAALQGAHCRTVAAALGRLRAKIRHRPVVFELLPAEFTLFELQRAVEAILGPNLHKQNFRRLVEGMGLVEPTGEVKSHTGGRPARLFRFRPQVMLERSAPGMRIRPGKAA